MTQIERGDKEAPDVLFANASTTLPDLLHRITVTDPAFAGLLKQWMDSMSRLSADLEKQGFLDEDEASRENRVDVRVAQQLGAEIVERLSRSSNLSGESSGTAERLVSEKDSSTRRVNVNFSKGAYETLEMLAARKEKSMSDVLRDAIQLERWLSDAETAGWHVLLEKDGRVRELARF